MVKQLCGYFYHGETPTKVRPVEELKTVVDKWISDDPKFKSFELDGTLDGKETLYGVGETHRGGRYYMRFFYVRRYGVVNVVRSKYTVSRCDANSIKSLINGQIIKGQLLGVIDPVDYL